MERQQGEEKKTGVLKESAAQGRGMDGWHMPYCQRITGRTKGRTW